MPDQELLQARLFQKLKQHLENASPGTEIQQVETHISRLLIGPHEVYKLKKPVNFGFLDFSTLQRRKGFCEAEVRFNSRLAPQLYLGVVALDADGIPDSGEPAVEYAVKMRRFDDSGMLDKLLDAGFVSVSDVICLAEDIGRFHLGAAVVTDPQFGAPRSISHWFDENFGQIRPLLGEPALINQLADIQAWGEAQKQALTPLMQTRHDKGFIRECHGDLHPGNIVLHDEQFLLFDCIEFNDELRCIDVISDAAFLLMDLFYRGRRDLAYTFLDRYLQVTGDYEALPLLHFYIAYRALVRAKVALLTLQQSAAGERSALLGTYKRYAALAFEMSQPAAARLVITRGLSGSGKTTYSRALSRLSGMICLRSDVERKRLAGLAETDPSHSAADGGIYTPEFTERTYQRLAQLAALSLSHGYSVVIDATFLEKSRRDDFRALARSHGAGFSILNLFAPLSELEQRIRRRRNDASEADITVLHNQCDKADPLQDDERAHLIDVDTLQVPPGGRGFTQLIRQHIH
ncbi:AAA family ATPase [Granulosicoccaceae sp. 1_MG-2023]|nr:AAA family ATPase [Granulosicoccaceae sp. 1_MG-2023]